MKLQLPLADAAGAATAAPAVSELTEMLTVLNEQQKLADERVATWLDKTEHWISKTNE